MGDFVDRLTHDVDDGKSFLMFNFVKLKVEADYGARPDLHPEGVTSGWDADQHYATIFLPHLFTRASHPVFFSTSPHYPIMQPHAAGDELYADFDYVAIVRYRSRRDLVAAVCAVARDLGPNAMTALKLSGVERTFVVPVSAEWVSWVLATLPLVMVAALRRVSCI
jgi:hypothetical protein